MSQRDQLLVLANVVLPDDQDWMPVQLLLLYKNAHVLWHVAFCHKEFASLEVYCFFGRDVPHRSLTKRLVFLPFVDSCNVMVNSPIVLECFHSLAFIIHNLLLRFAIAHDLQVLSAPLMMRMLSAAAVCCVFPSLE